VYFWGNIMRAIVVAGIWVLLSAMPVLAKCHFDRFRTYFDGARSSSTGTADSGKTCEIHFNGAILSIEVTQQAQHGAAAWNGQLGENRVKYKSNTGYKGSDAFTLAIHGGGRKGVEGISYQTITIDVQ
jgi:hypothetical protein